MRQSNQIQLQQVETESVDIPGTALRVSRVALGTWAMGGWMWGGTDEQESVATIRAALEQGINLIDTAPVYGFGASEEIVGAALTPAGLRSQAIIATKVGLEWRDGKVYRNATRDRIMQEVDQSLRRLRTDYIDIYQVHWPDPLVPIEETAEAMRTLHDQGKIRIREPGGAHRRPPPSCAVAALAQHYSAGSPRGQCGLGGTLCRIVQRLFIASVLGRGLAGRSRRLPELGG
jgi:hypothetical protein